MDINGNSQIDKPIFIINQKLLTLPLEYVNKKYDDYPDKRTEIPMIIIFNIPIDESRVLIYSPLKKTAFIGNHSLADIVLEIISTSETDSAGNKSQDAGFLKFLDERKFFLPGDIPSDEYGIAGIRYDTVILFLANQCNLRCRYCYAHSGEHSPKTMSPLPQRHCQRAHSVPATAFRENISKADPAAVRAEEHTAHVIRCAHVCR